MSASPDTSAPAALLKSKVAQNTRIRKSAAARKYLRKKQLERGGVSDQHYTLQARSYDGAHGPGDVVKADGYVRTIHDMVALNYGFIPSAMGGQGGSNTAESVKKADNPVLSSTQGVANAIYGQEVYSLLNSEANVFSLLEKRPWQRSGERIVTAHGHPLGSGGSAENATLPDTDAPEWDTFETDPKTVVHNFDVSMIEQLLAGTDDDHFADNPMDWLRRWYGTGTEHQTGQGEHPKHINVQLCEDTDGGTDANNFNSIDKAISDDSESSLLTLESDNDIYGFDRSAGQFTSNVIHNGGATENFTLEKMDAAMTAVRESSGKEPQTDPNYFWLTGHDTFEIMEQEVGGKERLEPVRVQVGLNGVQTVAGDDVGITVNSYKDIPIFRSNDVTKDDVSRIYLVDSSTMFIKQLLPTQYYSTGVNEDNNPFAINRLGNEGMFLTVGELSMVNPKGHAKIRDLA